MYIHRTGERYVTSTPNSIHHQIIHTCISLINTTVSLLLAISHEYVSSCIPHSSLRISHNTGCGCNNAIFFFDFT